MEKKRLICILLAAILAFGISGCGLYTAGSADINTLPDQNLVYPSTFAYSFVGDVDTYVPAEVQAQMDQFAKSQWIQQAAAVTQVYTQIPELENGAKGIEPISVVMPELDLTKYSGHYLWRDAATGLEVSAYYRVIADVLTDELVKVYVDDAGNIKQYETVNLGKYDSVDEKQVESMRIALRGRRNEFVSDLILECYAPVSHSASSAYVLFTDTQDRMILSTRGALKTNSEMLQVVREVDLYAIVDP